MPLYYFESENTILCNLTNMLRVCHSMRRRRSDGVREILSRHKSCSSASIVAACSHPYDDGRLRGAPDGRLSRLGGRLPHPPTTHIDTDDCWPWSTVHLATSTQARRHLVCSRKCLYTLINDTSRGWTSIIEGFTRVDTEPRCYMKSCQQRLPPKEQFLI